MGQFSFITQDTQRPILIAGSMSVNPANQAFTVYMSDDKGNSWREDAYEGYGEFGGKDFYVLLAEMNSKGPDRDAGIDLAFSGKEGVLFPSLSESPKYFGGKAPESDPNQGWGNLDEADYDDEDEPEPDDDWDDEDLLYNDEIYSEA